MSPASGALQSYCVIIHAAGVSSGGPSCQVSVVGLHEAFVHHAEMKDPMLFLKGFSSMMSPTVFLEVQRVFTESLQT